MEGIKTNQRKSHFPWKCLTQFKNLFIVRIFNWQMNEFSAFLGQKHLGLSNNLIDSLIKCFNNENTLHWFQAF